METLVQAERRFTADMSPSDRAKRLYPRLADTVSELRRMALAAKTDAARELLELEAERVDQARELLAVLETEQWRQREAIGIFLYDGDRAALRRIRETWNSSPNGASPARPPGDRSREANQTEGRDNG